MMKALTGVSAAAAIALVPVCIVRAQAQAKDPCASVVSDPVAHQTCIDKFLRDMYRREISQCEASPNHGQLGQVCG